MEVCKIISEIQFPIPKFHDDFSRPLSPIEEKLKESPAVVLEAPINLSSGCWHGDCRTELGRVARRAMRGHSRILQEAVTGKLEGANVDLEKDDWRGDWDIYIYIYIRERIPKVREKPSATGSKSRI